MLMPRRQPREVLGVEVDASAAEVKAAWRRLARANHPDLTGDDPAASRAATRRMAEINDAYAALTRDRGGAVGRTGSGSGDDGSTFDAAPGRRQGGPPRAKPTRPVTGRVDTSETFRARNQAMTGSGTPSPLRGHPPRRADVIGREPPRASIPTGPLVRGRLRRFRRPPAPTLDQASATIMTFGKFHDHTLGEIAAFEPSYIDWLAGTVGHDPDLVSAARVIQADLDRRGIGRRSHPSPQRRGRTA